jgi:DNA repair protein RecN (Recombination protein N)
MLQRLYIRNYLLIDEAELALGKGLTIITGETGSGKSILLGALALAMGERAEAGALRDPSQRCVIEIEVDVARLDLRPWFEANAVPFEPTAILRRQLDPGGRSRAFVNDTPVRVEQLRELGARLVHVHSQHHTLLLNDHRFRLGLLDHLAGQRDRAAAYTARYLQWSALRAEVDRLREEEVRSRSEQDFINFQLNELQAADLRADEQERLEQDLARAEHAGELLRALETTAEGLAGERGVGTLIGSIRQELARAARFDPAVAELLQRLESAAIELKDIADEAEAMAARVDMDPAAAERVRERLDTILRLQQKHRVRSNVELLALQDELSQRAAAIGSLDQRMGPLQKEEEEARTEVLRLAQELSAGRMKAIAPLGERIEGMLGELGMPKAVFRVEHRTLEAPGPHGIDAVRLLFSANADRAPAPLDKVASGGELGRVMLALIAIAADSQDLPTVIFDEIDTGVSGEVADRVGSAMARMGEERQVLAITHLPQIAGKAAHHLLVTKTDAQEAVRTHISPLTMEQRVEAIARMLSGRKLTKAALDNARALLRGA